MNGCSSSDEQKKSLLWLQFYGLAPSGRPSRLRSSFPSKFSHFWAEQARSARCVESPSQEPPSQQLKGLCICSPHLFWKTILLLFLPVNTLPLFPNQVLPLSQSRSSPQRSVTLLLYASIPLLLQWGQFAFPTSRSHWEVK